MDDENMVLRTVYLPRELDDHLRSVAFTNEVSKGNLMRELISEGLQARRNRGEVPLADRPRNTVITTESRISRTARKVTTPRHTPK